MKKKVIAITAAFGVLFAGAGSYRILAGSAGYDAYKEAMKKVHTVDNATMEMEMSIFDNGNLLLSTETSMKFDKDNDLASGTVGVKTSNQELAFNTILQDGKPIIQPVGGAYYMPDIDHPSMKKKDGEKFHDPEMLKLAELVMDAVTQPVQSEFEQKGNIIIVDLEKKDFPSLIHTIGKQVIKMGFKAHSDIELTKEEYPFLTENFTSKLPNLKSEISIEKAYAKINLTEDGMIKSQDAVFEIQGKDEQGILHKMEIHLDLEIKDVDKTKVKEVTLSGKDVQKFEMKKVH